MFKEFNQLHLTFVRWLIIYISKRKFRQFLHLLLLLTLEAARFPKSRKWIFVNAVIISVSKKSRTVVCPSVSVFAGSSPGGPGLAAELSYNSINSPGGPARHGPSSDLLWHSPVNKLSVIWHTLLIGSEKAQLCFSYFLLLRLISLGSLCPREERTLTAPAPVCGVRPECEAWLARSRSRGGMERCQWQWHALTVNTVIINI